LSLPDAFTQDMRQSLESRKEQTHAR
jgi:hypothetical protein